jgi:hypothetical protein
VDSYVLRVKINDPDMTDMFIIAESLIQNENVQELKLAEVNESGEEDYLIEFFR